jgi:hypothetical protein
VIDRSSLGRASVTRSAHRSDDLDDWVATILARLGERPSGYLPLCGPLPAESGPVETDLDGLNDYTQQDKNDQADDRPEVDEDHLEKTSAANCSPGRGHILEVIT